MSPDNRVLAAGVATDLAWKGTNAYATGSHTINVNAIATGERTFITSSSTIPITIASTQTSTL